MSDRRQQGAEAMTIEVDTAANSALEEAIAHLREAAEAKKCWPCGCLDSGLTAIERAFPEAKRPVELDAVLRLARQRLVEVRYDCLGCEVCYPAVAINALSLLGGEHPIEIGACPTALVETREGWPPLPGSYRVLRYSAPVAVCTLTDEALAASVAAQGESELAIVGTMQTENLGIERLLENVLANPNIRFLVVCGTDSRQAIGHLPGQSLVALARSGVDERMRIIGAAGKRPVLRNLTREAIEHFRRTVEVLDLAGQDSLSATLDRIRDCAGRNPGPAEPFAREQVVAPIPGYLPDRMVSDPAGYFVVYVDQTRQLLSLEHYRTDGVLGAVIEGRTAPELYIPAVDKGLVSRLDHSAYLGRELARAEQALRSGEPFIQDAAPEAPAAPPVNAVCGCESHAQEGAT
jgi:tetrahydromethanopterin S-methyltransferase subunit A